MMTMTRFDSGPMPRVPAAVSRGAGYRPRLRVVMAGFVAAVLQALIPPARAADSAFDCLISASRTELVVGELPGITVRIRNQGGKDAYLVGALDGSTCGWRFPKCRLEIRDAAGRSLALPLARCGNMNLLRTNDFVLVRAGESFPPFRSGFFPPPEFFQFPVTQPGEYTVRFHYSTSDRIEDYFGDERMFGRTNVPPEILRRFREVPKLELKSNVLKLRFTAKPKKP